MSDCKGLEDKLKKTSSNTEVTVNFSEPLSKTNNDEQDLIRLFVLCVLQVYLESGKSTTKPVKCLDLMGNTKAIGLEWKKHFGEKVDVFVNDCNPNSMDSLKNNAENNNLLVHVTNIDPMIVLHTSGYSFMYIDSKTESSHYFDGVFRNISRNGVLVITTKDDPSLQGSNSDSAYRRYGGRITRTVYSHELAIRLVTAAMARSAAKYNKGIRVLCCFGMKGTFTIAVMVEKGPLLANSCLDQVGPMSHCLACSERRLYPVCSALCIALNQLPVGPEALLPPCHCSEDSPSTTYVELGPLWTGDIFSPEFVENMIQYRFKCDVKFQSLLKVILEEARCEGREVSEAKKQKLTTGARYGVAFYYGLYFNHPGVNSVVDLLRSNGYRASRTHFDRHSVRTNATLSCIRSLIRQAAYES